MPMFRLLPILWLTSLDYINIVKGVRSAEGCRIQPDSSSLFLPEPPTETLKEVPPPAGTEKLMVSRTQVTFKPLRLTNAFW